MEIYDPPCIMFCYKRHLLYWFMYYVLVIGKTWYISLYKDGLKYVQHDSNGIQIYLRSARQRMGQGMAWSKVWNRLIDMADDGF